MRCLTPARALGAFALLISMPPQLVGQAQTGRSPVYAPHGVIATSQPLASAAGLEVLERGGNAFDAAVTAAAVLNLVEPHMTGIGGDMFALLWSARDHKLVGLNAGGRAGSGMTRETLVQRGRKEIPVDGAEPITVPGALSGWAALLQRYGTITLAQALAPAIKLAEEGFPVSPIIAGQWADEVERLQRDEGAKATFLVDGARAPKAGEWFRNPDLARSFRAIAKGGPAVLYGGELGARIVRRVDSLGGFLTLDDLKRQKIEWVEPISVPFKGYRVWELPPNNQGVAVLEMLRILEPYDLAALGHNSAPYLHRLIEAKKLAFADLARYVGDPAAMTTPVSMLFSDSFIAQRRGKLDQARAAERQEPGAGTTASETIYLTAADAQGNMVSFINSLFEAFGSGVVVPGTGFALQDRGAGFTLDPGLPNTVAPGKRPFHTLIPGLRDPLHSGRRAALDELRGDGRVDAAAGPCAVAAQSPGFRHGTCRKRLTPPASATSPGCRWPSNRGSPIRCVRRSRRWVTRSPCSRRAPPEAARRSFETAKAGLRDPTDEKMDRPSDINTVTCDADPRTRVSVKVRSA